MTTTYSSNSDPIIDWDADGEIPQPQAVVNANRMRIANENNLQDCQVNEDRVSVEEPLQISLLWQDEDGKEQEQVFTVTMRTPGNDGALAMGLLYSEGLIRSSKDIAALSYAIDDEESTLNQLEVTLASGIVPDLQQYHRHLTTQSSCGICGKTSLQSLEMKDPPPADTSRAWLDIKTIIGLSDTMRTCQQQFQETGGVHAVGLFDRHGKLLLIREDVGRHNAMDKLVGADLFSRGNTTSTFDGKRVVVLSGRISFELVQKAVMARIPVVVAVGAPSSLAIAVAKRFDLTLVGFVSRKGFNVYHGDWRLKKSPTRD